MTKDYCYLLIIATPNDPYSRIRLYRTWSGLQRYISKQKKLKKNQANEYVVWTADFGKKYLMPVDSAVEGLIHEQ